MILPQGFVLDSLNGHHGPHGGPCTSDVDCSNGCCVNMKSPLGLFSHMECRPYHLPGAACDTASTGKGLDCGCMPGRKIVITYVSLHFKIVQICELNGTDCYNTFLHYQQFFLDTLR